MNSNIRKIVISYLPLFGDQTLLAKMSETRPLLINFLREGTKEARNFFSVVF